MWLALLLLAISTSFGQVRNVGNDVVDALERGSRMRAERERLELDKERQNEELRLTRMKTERLRAETEQIKAQTEALQNDAARSSQTAAVRGRLMPQSLNCDRCTRIPRSMLHAWHAQPNYWFRPQPSN